MTEQQNRNRDMVQGRETPAPVGVAGVRVGPARPLFRDCSASTVGNQAGMQDKIAGTDCGKEIPDPFIRRDSLCRSPPCGGVRPRAEDQLNLNDENSYPSDVRDSKQTQKRQREETPPHNRKCNKFEVADERAGPAQPLVIMTERQDKVTETMGEKVIPDPFSRRDFLSHPRVEAGWIDEAREMDEIFKQIRTNTSKLGDLIKEIPNTKSEIKNNIKGLMRKVDQFYRRWEVLDKNTIQEIKTGVKQKCMETESSLASGIIKLM